MNDTKNAAPERIELPSGWRVEKVALPNKQLGESEDFICDHGGSVVGSIRTSQSERFAAAMQPVPCESDAAVAREIAGTCLTGSGGIVNWIDERKVAAILARHRQKPAAVSRTEMTDEDVKILSSANFDVSRTAEEVSLNELSDVKKSLATYTAEELTTKIVEQVWVEADVDGDALGHMLEPIIQATLTAEREAGKLEGLNEAADICGSLAEGIYADGDEFIAAVGCESAIRALLPKDILKK